LRRQINPLDRAILRLQREQIIGRNLTDKPNMGHHL
jgi:hypothetical protein